MFVKWSKIWKSKSVRSISLLLAGSFLLFLYLLRPLQSTEPTAQQTPYVPVFDPDNEVGRTAYGKQLLAILAASRHNPLQAQNALSLLFEKQPLAERPIYTAYRLMILANLAQHQQDNERVIEYSEQLKALANEEYLLWLKAESIVELAIQYAKAGELGAAEREVEKALNIAEPIRYERLLVKAYNTAGVIFNIRGDLVSAQSYFHKGLELGKQYPLHIYNSKLTSNMALMYIYLEEWEKALTLIEEGKHLYHESGLLDNTSLGLLFSNEAFVHFRRGDVKRTRAAYEQAASIAKQGVSKRFEVVLMKSETELLLLEGEPERSYQVSNECLALPYINDYLLEQGHCYKNRALSAWAMHSDDEAASDKTILTDLYVALELYEQVGSRNWIIAGHRSLANYFEAIGDTENALKYFKLYYTGNKSLLFDRRQSEVYVLEESFNTRMIQQDNELLSTEKELAGLKLEEQKLRTRIVAALVFAVVLGFGFVVRRSYLVQVENEQLVEQTTTCSLTGLYNRRYLEEYLKEVENFSDTPFGSTIAILDLDHFKSVNDTFGHDVGDEVLVEVSKRMKVSIGDEGIIGRWGGEEFVCILRGTKCPETKLNTIRQSISKSPMYSRAGKLSISTSIGAVGGLTKSSVIKSPQGYLKYADIALYEAKQKGRDCVVLKAS